MLQEWAGSKIVSDVWGFLGLLQIIDDTAHSSYRLPFCKQAFRKKSLEFIALVSIVTAFNRLKPAATEASLLSALDCGKRPTK